MSTSDPRHYDIIISPVITEKATMASEHNKVVFKVNRNASKPQIKEAVEKLFDVKVKRVNTLIRGGKIKIFKGRRGELQKIAIKWRDECYFFAGAPGDGPRRRKAGVSLPNPRTPLSSRSE